MGSKQTKFEHCIRCNSMFFDVWKIPSDAIREIGLRDDFMNYCSFECYKKDLERVIKILEKYN